MTMLARKPSVIPINVHRTKLSDLDVIFLAKLSLHKLSRHKLSLYKLLLD
jgi:hypothetical protein